MKSRLLLALLCAPSTLSGFNLPQFYHAHHFFGEPRLTRNYLTTGDVCTAYTKSFEGRNALGEKTCLLNIYGKHNMRLLGSGVPNKDITNPLDLALIDLANIPHRDNFAQLVYAGRLKLIETTITLTQNLRDGFFFSAVIPFNKITLDHTLFQDCSPNDTICPNINTPEWQTFLTLFEQILKRYNLSTASYEKEDLINTTLIFGWGYSYLESCLLDYVDLTIKAGVITPAVKESNQNNAFDIPFGYDKHIGFLLSFDTACGVFDWLSFGTHASGIVFHEITKDDLRMKTNIHQSGFIKLAQGKAIINKGSLWNAGIFAKADHALFGLSLIVGYSATYKKDDTITPKNTVLFSPSIVNSDEQFKEWSMHTLNFLLEYDFAQKDCSLGPRICFFYNQNIGGKRIVNSHNVGGCIGLDIAWEF